jgi:hypothetical protein
MPSFLYNSAKESFLGGTNTIDLLAGRLGVAIVSTSYSAAATHSTMTNIGTSNILKTSFLNTVVGTTPPTQSSGITITNGILDGPDLTVLAVPGTQVTANALVLFQQDATGSTQVATAGARLIAYIDSASSGLPISNPNGANITIVFDNGPNRIFAL